MNAVMISLSIVGILAASALNAFGQVSVTSETYSQNFDGLAATGTNAPAWVDNSTLSGWYSHRFSITAPGSVPFLGDNGFGGDLSWYGNNSDHALGSSYNMSVGSVSFGVRLVNNTGAAVDQFQISFVGEQWRRSTNFPQATDSLAFSYQIFDAGTGSLTNASWISMTNLDFISPNATATSGLDLNGNAPENQVAYSSWITGISLTEGQELWLRWTTTSRAPFSGHGLAIDDLTVTFGAIPEPAAYAALVGGLTLLTVGLRRRGRKSA